MEAPNLFELPESETNDILSRGWLAHMAFSWHDQVDIEPIGYVYDPPWIFGRTSVGAKLLKLAHNSWCAVEVEEVDGPFEWRSVVVKGPFSALNSHLGEDEKFGRAVAALRKLVPAALRAEDPFPERNVVFGVYVQEMTGRKMSLRG